MRKPKEPQPDRLVFPVFSGRKPDLPESDRLTSPGMAAKKPDGTQADPLVFPDYMGGHEEQPEEQIEPTRRISINRRGLLIVGGLSLVALLSYFPILWLASIRSAARR